MTKDILNTGVKPSLLLDAIRGNFEAKGGVVLEKTAISGISVRPDEAELDTSPLDGGDGPGAITARLVVDCMGFASPIVRQARWGQKPDGVCLVVGACARGFDESANESADLIYTTSGHNRHRPVERAVLLGERSRLGAALRTERRTCSPISTHTRVDLHSRTSSTTTGI